MSQDRAYIAFPSLMAELQQLCREGRTGTLFIATDDDNLVRMSLDHGEIVFVTFQNRRGQTALPLMLQINAGRLRFEEDMLSSTSKTSLPATPAILQYLIAAGASGETQPTTTPSAGIDLSLEAKRIIEETLAEFIGPLANLVCEEHFGRAQGLKAAVEVLAGEIQDPDRARRFLEQIGTKACFI